MVQDLSVGFPLLGKQCGWPWCTLSARAHGDCPLFLKIHYSRLGSVYFGGGHLHMVAFTMVCALKTVN